MKSGLINTLWSFNESSIWCVSRKFCCWLLFT